MNNLKYRELIETSWRRPLNDEEHARLRSWLVTHPEAQADWEVEVMLNQTLGRLPNAPVASNFTALVMQSVDLEEGVELRRISVVDRLKDLFRRRGPRLAWALVLIGAVWMGVRQHEKASRHELAQGLAALVNMAAQPDPRALQDMGAIQQLSQIPPREDDELLKVLSQ